MERYVLYLDRQLAARYRAATDHATRHELALAGFANVTFWLAWLRSSETFSLLWSDLEWFLPEEGPTIDLPPDCGALLYKLLPQTKSARDRRADVVVAIRVASTRGAGVREFSSVQV